MCQYICQYMTYIIIQHEVIYQASNLLLTYISPSEVKVKVNQRACIL